MKKVEMEKILNSSDFHIDPLGRVVIENVDLLSAINGAGQADGELFDMWNNAGCVNGGC
jgi:hypothetical protein